MSFLVISKGKLAFDIECNIWITKYFQSTMFVSVYLFIYLLWKKWPMLME